VCLFSIRYFSRMKSNPAKKTSEQCFSSEMKPTCQNSASFEHFQKWPKNPGEVLACSLSIVLFTTLQVQYTIPIKTCWVSANILMCGSLSRHLLFIFAQTKHHHWRWNWQGTNDRVQIYHNMEQTWQGLAKIFEGKMGISRTSILRISMDFWAVISIIKLRSFVKN